MSFVKDQRARMRKVGRRISKVYEDIKHSPLCYKCDKEECLRKENEELRKRIVTIFDCLIKANRDIIVDTLWVDKITTLWDYIAQTLGIEGDQNQIEEQVEMLYSEGE